jgi:hypothetical protein
MSAIKKQSLTFAGKASEPFWQAVWGYYGMSSKRRRMGAAKRFDLLYSYGCRAQELEETIKQLRAAVRRLLEES